MPRIDVAINSQTPPVSPRAGQPPPSGVWRLGRDYEPQLGGVVPMMRALLRTGLDRWIRRPARWIALGAPGIPESITTDEGYILDTVQLSEQARKRYNRFKEAIWRSFHGPRGLVPSLDDFRGFVDYSQRSAMKLLGEVERHDLFYVNDFQQVLVGGLIGPAAPALLRWHIPLDFRGYPEPVSRFFLKAMEGFDGIIVSTQRGLEELIQVGFNGRAFQMYPYIDPAEIPRATPGELRAFADAHGLGEGPIILTVGRMDPTKRQDLLIAALPRVRRHHPTVRLVIVGGTSFSTKAGGLGSSKARDWRRYLERRVKTLGLGREVVFTGVVSNRELAAAYAAADVFVHPAPWEGFGLVAIEAWTHGRPIIVSRGAGVAELVMDGVNGFTTPPGRVQALADQIVEALDRPDRAERMGAAGAITARRCHVDLAHARHREIFERTIGLYERSGLRTGRPGRRWRP
ncbi:MAG TPA: glycosyltransferase family 4 protein [Thermoplasmata archaeon]|nr:glycosyltransferase family 4 protein [Thermoplasmata archaeon]